MYKVYLNGILYASCDSFREAAAEMDDAIDKSKKGDIITIYNDNKKVAGVWI